MLFESCKCVKIRWEAYSALPDPLAWPYIGEGYGLKSPEMLIHHRIHTSAIGRSFSLPILSYCVTAYRLAGLLRNHLWLPGRQNPNVKDLRLSSHMNIMCCVTDPTALPHCSRTGERMINSFVDQVLSLDKWRSLNRELTKSETMLQMDVRINLCCTISSYQSLFAREAADRQYNTNERDKNYNKTTTNKNRTIGVWAQSTLGGGGKTFLSENICIKINKMPEFYTIFARKK